MEGENECREADKAIRKGIIKTVIRCPVHIPRFGTPYTYRDLVHHIRTAIRYTVHTSGLQGSQVIVLSNHLSLFPSSHQDFFFFSSIIKSSSSLPSCLLSMYYIQALCFLMCFIPFNPYNYSIKQRLSILSFFSCRTSVLSEVQRG